MAAILVSGALAAKPWNGGEAWVRLSYVLGLRRLGHEVRFLEQIDPAACTAGALEWFDCVNEAFELRAALLLDDGTVVRGSCGDELSEYAGEAELLLNVSGNLTWDPLFSRVRRRAYLDLDPGYTQVWHEQGHEVGRLGEHHVHLTVGTALPTGRCDLPTGGLDWRPTLRPVLLDLWRPLPGPGPDRFTTVARWRGGYGRLEHRGRLFGQKAHEFRAVVALPTRVAATFELALDIEPGDDADRRLLEENGWRLADPCVAHTPNALRRYVEDSGAEFSVAQGVYVETACGWFSDRTACYLAAGRPAVVQDTGVAGTLPVGDGLLTFRTLDDAVAAVNRVRDHYADHCAAARALAEEHLDSTRVLGAMLEDALAT